MTEAGGRRVATYSGGMRRRLDIAMSLIGNPPVIFLDEPTAGLDPQARIEVWQAVKKLAEGGTTVLLTTQYLEEAEQLADRIAILHEGRIIVNGTLTELKALLPPAKVEYVEKQPSLEDVFLSVVGKLAFEEILGHADLAGAAALTQPDHALESCGALGLGPVQLDDQRGRDVERVPGLRRRLGRLEREEWSMISIAPGTTPLATTSETVCPAAAIVSK